MDCYEDLSGLKHVALKKCHTENNEKLMAKFGERKKNMNRNNKITVNESKNGWHY